MKRILTALCLLAAAVAALPSPARSQTVTRLTYYQGGDLGAVWDPRGGTIAYVRAKNPGGQVYDAYSIDSSGQGKEQEILTGANVDFGTAVELSWIGSTGFLAVQEAISGFEVLKFDTSQAPFSRIVSNGVDAANSLLLNINGGGGAGLLRISRDGTTALTRFSSSGSSGSISVRVGAVSSMTGQAASTFGTAVVSITTGDTPYLNGGAISPDGSKYVLPIPFTTSTSGHDLVLRSPTNAFSEIALTSTAAAGGLNYYPDFSPDGTRIVFSRRSANPADSFDLYMVNTDGTGLKQLTDTPNFSETIPYWSPDGGSIVFTGTHASGHESEPPALEAGESANANIYILTLAAADSPSIVTPKTKLKDPPLITIEDRTVTFLLTPFQRAQLKATAKLLERAKKKVSFKYELVVSKSEKKRDQIKRISKRNSVTLRNLPPGNYTAKYRVEITSKEGTKPPVVKDTKFSPSAPFTVRDSLTGQ